MAIKILSGIDVIGSMNITASDVPSLDAGKITTGTFASARIPTLDASKIASGTLTANRIPSLDASKITTGTLSIARIPNLGGTYALTSAIPTNVSELTNDINYLTSLPSHNHAASEITSGTLADARIPNLNASKITAGTFSASHIPDLDGSKITSGTISSDRLNINQLSGYLAPYYDLKGTASQVDARITQEVIPSIPNNTNQLINGAGYLTSVPAEYATDADVSSTVTAAVAAVDARIDNEVVPFLSSTGSVASVIPSSNSQSIIRVTDVPVLPGGNKPWYGGNTWDFDIIGQDSQGNITFGGGESITVNRMNYDIEVSILARQTFRVDYNGVHVSILEAARIESAGPITASSITLSGGVVAYANIHSTMNITAGGDVIAYYSSDRRLKDNLTPIENACEKVQKLTGYEFDWNNNQDVYEGHDIGVVAQEVEEVFPDIVKTRDTGYKAVDYKKLVAVLIEANKELQNRVKTLEDRIDGLTK